MSKADDNFERFARHQWNRFETMARHGFGRWGRGMGGPGGRGGWGDFGDSFRIGRMMAAGDLRLIALYFIEQQPRHGYDLIKAIEDKTGGIYVPSPGVIYPALTFLEEANYVTSTAEGNKRLYTITEEGKTYLNDNRSAVETTLDYLGKIGERAQHLRARWEEAEHRFSEGFGPAPHHPHPPHAPDIDMEGVIPDVNEARRDLKDAIKSAKKADSETQRHVARILMRAAEEIRRTTNPRPEPDVDL